MSAARGMTDAGRDEVGRLVLGAWDGFLAQADAVDLHRRTRLPGWRAQEVCTDLGVWPDAAALDDLVAGARSGATGTPADPNVVNARVTTAHRDASRAEVLAALERARAATVRYLTEAPAELDTAPTVSTVGRLPLLSVVLGQAYELAVHGLDLVSAGAPAPPRESLQAGLAALADVTGALTTAAGITAGATLTTPDGGWTFAAADGGWTVRHVPSGRPAGPAVEAPADLLLDAASGRANPVAALARRRLAVHQLAGLMRLAPVVESAPGIPGGPLLQLAARTLGGAGGLLGRLRRG
ncbi:maleylpyruvate isomerase N-terminal domain-containing protein [Modestobacter sp. SYSU DS0875]